MTAAAQSILGGAAKGPVLVAREPLSFWGGVDPATGRVIDVHHPLHGQCLGGTVLMMPSSRGSCTGSGVLLDMALGGRAPAALVFCETEDVVTLGALVAAEMFGKRLPVVRLAPASWARLSRAESATITGTAIDAPGLTIPVTPPATVALDLAPQDRAMLDGAEGPAAQQAMRILCAMAVNQGATRLTDVTRGHVDGCIYASRSADGSPVSALRPNGAHLI